MGDPFSWTNMEATNLSAGTGPVYDLHKLGESMANGEWDAVGIYGATATVDAIATASDPIGSLLAAGLGWLMEHLEPLKGWLDDLAGDPAAVLGQAQVLSTASTNLTGLAEELRGLVATDFSGLEAEAISAYVAFTDKLALGLDALSSSANGGAKAIEVASQIVEFIRGVVRDALAQVVGAIISYVAELVISLGLATPWVIEQATTRTAALATRCESSLLLMTRSFGDLNSLLDDAMLALRALGHEMRSARPHPRHRGTPKPPEPVPTPDILGDLVRNSPYTVGSETGSVSGNKNDG